MGQYLMFPTMLYPTNSDSSTLWVLPNINSPVCLIFRKFESVIFQGDATVDAFSSEFYDIRDTTDTWFLMTLSRIPEPKIIDSFTLDKMTTYIFYNLTNIEDNSYIKITSPLINNLTIDYFFVTDSNYGVIDLYQGNFTSYLAPWVVKQLSAMNND